MQQIQVNSTRPNWRLWYGLVSADLILISITLLLGVLVKIGGITEIPGILNIGRDWSIGEIFNYMKWAALIYIFFLAYKGTKEKIFAVGVIFFTLVLMDDSLQLHESFGSLAFRFSDYNSSILVQVGEISFWLTLGVLSLVIFLKFWAQTPEAIKRHLVRLLFLFIGIIFCGVVVDFIHSLTTENSWLSGFLLIVEDGGEMIFISLMASYAFDAFIPSGDLA